MGSQVVSFPIAWCCQATVQEAMDRNQCTESSLKYEEELLSCEGDRKLNKLPREVVVSSSLEILKSHLDVILSNML